MGSRSPPKPNPMSHCFTVARHTPILQFGGLEDLLYLLVHPGVVFSRDTVIGGALKGQILRWRFTARCYLGSALGKETTEVGVDRGRTHRQGRPNKGLNQSHGQL